MQMRSIQALPDELLLETFRYLEIEDRVAVRAVCRTWRALSSACPVLVRGQLSEEDGLLRSYLDQMRPAPLFYYGSFLIDDDDSLERRTALITNHLDHTVVLSITNMSDDDGLSDDIIRAIEVPAPLLRCLKLMVGYNSDVETTRLLGNCAPLLTRCYLYVVTGIIEAVTQFKTIRVLVLAGFIFWDDVQVAFSAFPVLEELSLEFRNIDNCVEDMLPPGSLTPPTRLRHLTVAADSASTSRCLGWVFEAVQHDAIPTITVKHYRDSRCRVPYPAAIDKMLEVLSVPAVVRVDVGCCRTAGRYALRLESADGRKRVHAGLNPETLSGVLATKVPSLDVREMTLGGDVHVLEPKFLPSLDRFTNLRELTLVISGYKLGDAFAIPPVRCPALEAVTIAVTLCDYMWGCGRVLSAQDVCAFLQDKLGADVRKLKRLVFRGISVDDVFVIHPLADTIRVRAFEPLTDYVRPEAAYGASLRTTCSPSE